MGAATLFVHNVSIFRDFRKIILGVIRKLMEFWSWTEFWISEWLTFHADSVYCSSYQ